MKGKGKRPSAFGRKPKKQKPPSKDSMEAMVGRKLSDTEISERQRRLAHKQVELTAHRKRKAKLTKEVNADIKSAEVEVEKLAEEIVAGEEMVKQGDLFVDGSTHSPTKDQTAKGLAEVAKRAGVTPADGKGPEATA